MGEKYGRPKSLDAAPVVEKLTQAEGETKVAEPCVIEASRKQGPGVLVGEREGQPADGTKADHHPVARNDRREAEGQGARQGEGPARVKPRL